MVKGANSQARVGHLISSNSGSTPHSVDTVWHLPVGNRGVMPTFCAVSCHPHFGTGQFRRMKFDIFPGR